MPIDKNGYIIPPEEDKKRKRSNYMITKIIKNIAVVSVCISAVALILQKKSYDTQKEYYETYINKLEIDLKKENPQIKTSYLRCGFTHLSVVYRYDDYKIINNEISDIYYINKNGEKVLKNDRDSLKELFNIKDNNKWLYSEVVFLNIESFGNRNMEDMKVITEKVIYENDYDCLFNRFEDLNLDVEEIISKEQKIIYLGDRRAGENFLIPVVLQYEIHNEIKEDNYEDFYVYTLPENVFIYKIVYIPKFIKYYDSIIEEEVTVEVRDLLENCIETSVFISEQG